MIHLPGVLIYAASDDSPGRVEYHHDSHVDAERPNCVTCHTAAMPILHRPGASRPALTGERLHESDGCGACHDGESAFALEDDREACHLEEQGRRMH